MYLYHRYVDDEFVGISDLALSPLLAATGEAFERDQIAALLDARVYSVGDADSPLSFDEEWTGDSESDIARFTRLVEDVATGRRQRPVVCYQPQLVGTVGAWPIRGDADVVIVTPEDGPGGPAVDVRVVEIKSSNRVKTHHQLQAAIYTLLVESLLADRDTRLTASVVTQDPDHPSLADVVTASGDVDVRRISGFDLATRQNDVQLLLEDGGTFDNILLDDTEIHSGGNPPLYRVDARCDGCSKQAKCVAHSVTQKRLSLLGLTEGVQESLRELGVTDLRDMATLYHWPLANSNREATSTVVPRPRDPTLVTRILRETEVSNLLELAQIAHRFLRQIDPEYEAAWADEAESAGPWADYLLGTGRNLPDDSPPPNFDLGYPRKSLVRVYPYVQHDFVRDRVALLGARVTCTRHEESGGDGRFVVATPDSLPTESVKAKDAEEHRLIETFVDRLTAAIGAVRPDLGSDGIADGQGFLHLYPYGNSQRRALVEAVKRHPDSAAAQSLRTLLGYRSDIDQEVVSVLRDEFRERHALRYPGLGLVQTVAQFYSSTSELDWEAPRAPDETPLKRVFDLDFFETTVPYTEVGDRILLRFSDGLQIPSDRLTSAYPVLHRNREVLPLEYLYATAEFDKIDPAWADDEAMRERIVRYRHHDVENSPRVTLDDITDGVHSICRVYEHIERSIRNKDATVEKVPLHLDDLERNTLGVSALQSTCLEYQDLEFGTTRQTLERRYRTPLAQRAATGQALPFEVTVPPIEADKEEEERTWVEGSLLRSLGAATDDGVLPDTPISLEAGSFVVMTPLSSDGDGILTEEVTEPRRIANQVLGRLTHVDTSSGTVRVSLNWATNQPQQPFRPNHVGWTTDEADEYDRQYVAEGMQFVLDLALDDFTANRTQAALQHADENDVHNRLVNLYDDEIADALRTDQPLFDPDAVRTFLETFDRVMPETTNRDQQSFVSQLDHTVAALQGPPGTGKTAYASSPALLARAYASKSSAFAGVGTAHSNTAVDELATAVGEAQAHLADAGILEDATLVRVRSDSITGALPESVTELHYFDHRDELQALFNQHVLAADAPGPLLVFATPVTLRNTVHAVRGEIDDEIQSAEALMTAGRARLFDTILVDESSMMDLPLLFLGGAFLGRNRQLLLVGDHPQMQPIQSHDWDAEDRQTIEENTPAVSALDFIRFLRGDADSNFERFEREPPQWHNKERVLPMDRLRTTYRLPPAMARFESTLFYYRDNITLESGGPSRFIPDVRTETLPEWLAVALDTEPRVTVLLHDDNAATKDSPVEAFLAEQLLDPLPVVRENPSEDEVSAGVVVPFRLMRRRLQNQLDVSVDTVERFQGGERDVMVLAMTAGNQGYVNQLSEFLLDANRFNVGASRMKRKLFIIVSKSLFRAVSSDPRSYEDHKAWKQLYQSMIAGEMPSASTELTSDEVNDLEGRTVTVELYTGYRD
jgi:uncharacterized protein